MNVRVTSCSTAITQRPSIDQDGTIVYLAWIVVACVCKSRKHVYIYIFQDLPTVENRGSDWVERVSFGSSKIRWRSLVDNWRSSLVQEWTNWIIKLFCFFWFYCDGTRAGQRNVMHRPKSNHLRPRLFDNRNPTGSQPSSRLSLLVCLVWYTANFSFIQPKMWSTMGLEKLCTTNPGDKLTNNERKENRLLVGGRKTTFSDDVSSALSLFSPSPSGSWCLTGSVPVSASLAVRWYSSFLVYISGWLYLNLLRKWSQTGSRHSNQPVRLDPWEIYIFICFVIKSWTN